MSGRLNDSTDPSAGVEEPRVRDALPLGVAEAGAAEEVSRAIRVAGLGHGAALDALTELCGSHNSHSVTSSNYAWRRYSRLLM